MTDINWSDYLEQVGFEMPGNTAPTSGTQQGAAAPGNPPGPSPDSGPNDPNIANMPQEQPAGVTPPDASADPQVPDMPEDHEDLDFEQWKNQYFRESIKGDPQILIDLIRQVNDREGLHENQEKFLSDNLNIQFLRQDHNIYTASNEIRKALKQDLDQNNPSVSIVNHLTEALQKFPDLNNNFIKIAGNGGFKGELHRKYIAALLGAVQVSGGGDIEDLIYNERTYSIRISTRMNSVFGNLHIGSWSLSASDPQDFLESTEQKRLTDGSPEERDVLRRRVIMESISDKFRKRAMLINVVGEDGTVYTLGWDLGSSLMAAYTEGKLICKTKQIDGSPAMITVEGQIVPFMDVKIYYAKENGQTNEDGLPDKDEEEFMSWKNGQLFLTGQLDTIKEAASAFQGIVFKESPYTGNPSDVKTLRRCVVSSSELLFRKC